MEIEELKKENAEIKHLLALALYGLGKINFESYHPVHSPVYDEIWTKYKKIAQDSLNEYGKKFREMKAQLEKECVWYEYTTKESLKNNHYFYVIGCNREVFAMLNKGACDFIFCPRCGGKMKVNNVGVILPTEVWYV